VGKDRSGRGTEAGGLSGARSELYGRRLGRPLRPARQAALDQGLPAMQVALPAFGMLDPRSLFGVVVRSVWLEIGAGNGEHAVWQAERNPDTGMIAVEPFVNGMSNLLALAQVRGLANIRVLADDARVLLDRLAPASIGRAFVLFPDPWPKRRHWRRRIVNPPVLDSLARVMSAGAELRVATDHPDYLVWMLRVLRAHPGFVWSPAGADDWRQRPTDWPETRFEAKGREAGRPSTYLSLRRV
jgi:tRNA (guanine-N7-)-methyltransferase